MSSVNNPMNMGGEHKVALGIIAIILGVLAMLTPGLTGLSIAIMLGVLVVAAGFVRLYWAFKAGSFGRGMLLFVVGALTVLAGIALLANPVLASGVLTIILAVYFLLDGLLEIVAGFRLRPVVGSNWGWLLFGGVVSLLLGLMIWSQFPLSGAWAMGILVGIKLFFIGLIMVTLSSAGSTAAHG